MTNLQSLLNSAEAGNTIIMVSADMMRQLIDDVTANTRRIVEEQYQPKYYTVSDMMKLFSVSQATIYKWMSRGVIKPYYMVEGGKPYFDQAEINKAMGRGDLGKYVHK